MWLELLSEIGERVLLAVAPLLAGMIAAWLGGLIKQAWAKAHQMVGEEWAWALDVAAEMAVRAAEQLKLAGLIEDKKDYAVATAQAYLDERGIKVDLSLIEAAIEAAVIGNFPKAKK